MKSGTVGTTHRKPWPKFLQLIISSNHSESHVSGHVSAKLHELCWALPGSQTSSNSIVTQISIAADRTRVNRLDRHGPEPDRGAFFGCGVFCIHNSSIIILYQQHTSLIWYDVSLLLSWRRKQVILIRNVQREDFLAESCWSDPFFGLATLRIIGQRLLNRQRC